MIAKRTKIIATIGPASDNRKTVLKLIKAGMNIARLNFSHGDQASHLTKINMLKQLIDEGNNIAIMLDTKGPEIRSGEFKNGEAAFKKGKIVRIYMEPLLGDETRFSVSYPQLIKDVQVGDVLLFDDGTIGFKIIAVHSREKYLECKTLNEHTMKSRRGCAVPNVALSMPFMGPKDEEDIRFGCRNDVDYIAASFVRSAKNIQEIKRILREEKKERIQVIAKIECQEAVDRLDEIAEASDGVMVARGDLGVFVPPEEVPVIQRKIVKICAEKGKPVIIATHMLDSMKANPSPTRAEVSDVANAIYESCDAIMLSGESANGLYPVESVAMGARIASRIEKATDKEDASPYLHFGRQKDDAIAGAITTCALMTSAKLIVAFSLSGATARRIARYRPLCPIVSLSDDKTVARSLCLFRGVYGLTIEGDPRGKFEEIARKTAFDLGYKKNDVVLISGGNGRGSTDFLKILTL